MTDTLEQIKQVIINTCDPVQIILFGSRARDDNRPDSDYDVMVITNKKERHFKMSGDIHRQLFKEKVKYPVDVIFSTPVKFDEQCSSVGFIYKEIKKEGICIYGK